MSKFWLEADYIVYDRRRVARILPTLSAGDRDAFEEALHRIEDTPPPDETSIQQEIVAEIEKALNTELSIAGGLISAEEVANAFRDFRD